MSLKQHGNQTANKVMAKTTEREPLHKVISNEMRYSKDARELIKTWDK